MSRSSTPVPAAAAAPSPSLPLLMLVLMLMPRSAVAAAAEATATNVSCDVRSCALLEASLLEEYVSGLNASGQPLGEVDSGDPALPPFGALPSDWSRLLMLQNSQPEGTPLRESLLRLSRLLLAAYFDSQERHGWTDQILTGRVGRGDVEAAGAASEPESEDQQASNATAGSTAQKTGARINADYNNGPSQPSGGNFSGDEGADSTTSHYSGPNFNQTFSSAPDNEAVGSVKSNETSSPDSSSAEANEVLHDRSREEHRRRLEEDRSSDESLPSLEFNSTKSLEDFFASAENSAGLVDDFFATEAASSANETEAPGFASSEEGMPLTKSLEDFLAEADATPSRSAEDFFGSAEATTEILGEAGRNEDDPTTTTTTPGEAAGGDRSPMPLGASAAPPVENRTSDRPDDLFSEPTTATAQWRPGDDWNSTGSIEPASDGGNTPVTVRLRRSVPLYLRLERSPAPATTAQPVPPAPSDGAPDSREEEASSEHRNRQRRTVRRNKRRTRKRAGVEGQYPSFDGREPGQALLDDERSAENSVRSLQ